MNGSRLSMARSCRELRVESMSKEFRNLGNNYSKELRRKGEAFASESKIPKFPDSLDKNNPKIINIELI